jgi:hypothetical protein
MKHWTSIGYSYKRGREAPRKRVMGRQSSKSLTVENGVTFASEYFSIANISVLIFSPVFIKESKSSEQQVCTQCDYR